MEYQYTGLNFGTSPREKYSLKDTNTLWLDTFFPSMARCCLPWGGLVFKTLPCTFWAEITWALRI